MGGDPPTKLGLNKTANYISNLGAPDASSLFCKCTITVRGSYSTLTSSARLTTLLLILCAVAGDELTNKILLQFAAWL